MTTVGSVGMGEKIKSMTCITCRTGTNIGKININTEIHV
jgi:hypothetical protein